MDIVLFLYRKVSLLRVLRFFIGFYQLFISYAWLLKAFLYSFHKQTLPYTFAYTKILYTSAEEPDNGNVAEVTILAQHKIRSADA